MNDNVTFLGMDDDDDKTVFQTEEERKKLEQEIAQLGDEDTTEIDISQQNFNPTRSSWQHIFN